MSRGNPDELYDYGPPVDAGLIAENVGQPQDNSDAVVVEDEGDSPLAPPPNTDTIVEPGGDPTDEAEAGFDPSITSLTPDTAVAGADVTVTVAGERFTADSVVEVNQAPVPTVYVSGTELTATFNGAAGTAGVTVRNPAAEQESNTVDFTFTEA